MRKTILPIVFGMLCTSFAMIPANEVSPLPVTVYHTGSEIFKTKITDLSSSIYVNSDLQKSGLSREAFDFAWTGYQRLLKNNRIKISKYLTVCDFSQPSSNKRLYIIDVEKAELVTNTYVAHGKNSGGEYATDFSDKPESHQSSLGFYVTAETYTGKHGLSLRVHGVDPGFNQKAYERTIVIHGADYVDARRAQTGVMMGRSFGCPAVPKNESASIISKIKNGTCLFIYHPGKKYLQNSKILNG